MPVAINPVMTPFIRYIPCDAMLNIIFWRINFAGGRRSCFKIVGQL